MSETPSLEADSSDNARDATWELACPSSVNMAYASHVQPDTEIGQHMEPTDICLRKVSEAAEITDSTVIAKVADALDELEAAYPHPNDRVIALERVFSDFSRRRPSTYQTPTGRLIRVSIERRQIRCSRRYA